MATVSSSPDTTTTNPPTTSTNSAANPPSHLAKLLSDALADAESLREDLKKERKRADNAERLATALQTVHGESNGTSATSPPPANHASSSSTQPPVNAEKITQLLTEFQARAERAERERDEEYARRSAISDAWYQLVEYFDSVEFAMKDMRAGFHRIVADGGGILTPVTIPIPKNRGARSYQPSSSSLSSLPLPPAPSTRRPRTPSLEHSGQPPSKRARSDYHPDRSPYPPPQQPSYSSHPPPPVNLPQQQSRIIFQNQSQAPRSSSSQYPPQSTTHQFIPQTGQPSRQPQHRRASSGSSESASVDEMILEAADGSQATQASNGQLSPESNTRSRKRRAPSHEREVTYESHQRMSSHQQPPPPIPRTDFNAPVYRMQNGSLHNVGPLASDNSASGQREIQMHVFAPVVTGAPQKKAKFSGASIPSLSTASVGGTSMIMSGPTTAGIDSASSPPSGSYPAQNEQGQRICRQCGMPGRYKDGKCVEKWGPGPCGPGTVCDRCRKKMKRVERRGTLEQLQQQQLQQQSSAQRQAYGSQPLSFSPATPSHSSNALTRTDTLPANFDQPSTQTSQPPPRIIHPPAHSNGRSSSPYGHSPSSTSHGVDAEIPTSSVRDGPPEKTVGRLAQPRPSSRQTSRSRDSRSPSNNGRRDSGTQSTDVEDADGEAEGDDDAEAEGEAETPAAARGEKQSEGKDKENPAGGDTDRGDEEADLLEAVDAAEAKKA